MMTYSTTHTINNWRRKKMANLFEKMKQWNKEVSEKIEKREEKTS